MSDSVSFQNNARVNDRACFDILIIGDNIIETDEIFLVNLSTVFLDRLGNPSSATVTISHDGDGENGNKILQTAIIILLCNNYRFVFNTSSSDKW